MLRLRPLAVLVVTLVLVSATPLAAAQSSAPDVSTPTTLYFHIFDTFNKFVINTQPMDAEFFDVGGTNNPTLDGSPLNPVVDALPVAAGPWDLNTIYGTSTAGPVEYDFIENGRPRFHPEAGIAQDVRIDTSVEPVAYLYLDLRDVIGVNSLPTASPTFTVEFTMREGDDPGRHADLDNGAMIMQGKQTFHLVDTYTAPGAGLNALGYWGTYMTVGLVTGGGTDPGLPEDGADGNAAPGAIGTAPDGNPVIVPDADGIVELAVPLTIQNNGVIPKSEAFNVRIDWYQMEEAFGPDAFASGYIRLHASPDKQPRLEMNIMNPVYVSFIHPQVAAGTLLIHAGVNSPWGTYDIDYDNITVRVDGPSTPRTLNQVVAANQHVHGLHHLDAEITYLWKFRDEGAANGDYTITMEVPNGAGTATARATAGFTVEGARAFGIDDQGSVVAPSLDEGSQDSPGATLLAVLAGLAAAVLVLRRRWQE